MEYSSERKAPRISVGIPLYRSLKFLPILENNLRALGDEPLEIMISDRHLHDNAIDLLEKTFGEDSRIRFLRSRDGIGWAEHFNFMLREARGDFFLWMPHDDDFPEGFVQKLAAELERKPEAVIAYGQMRPIDRSGRSLWMPPLPEINRIEDQPWSARLAVEHFFRMDLGLIFRGLIRREPILSRNLMIRSLRGDIRVDQYWAFATGLIGEWVYVPEAVFHKRFHSKNTHKKWEANGKHRIAALHLLFGYLNDCLPRLSERWPLMAQLLVWELRQQWSEWNSRS